MKSLNINISKQQKQAEKAMRVLKSIKYHREFQGIYSDIPAALTDKGGSICWSNSMFCELAHPLPFGKNILDLIPQIAEPDKDKKIMLSGNVYHKETIPIFCEEEDFILYRFVDNQVLSDIQSKYIGYTGVVCHIKIDNYDQVISNLRLVERTALMEEAFLKILDFAKQRQALCEQSNRDKFIIVFERRFLNDLIADRFSILAEIHSIKTSVDQSLTFSISVGVGETLQQSNDFALTALDLAQARGGDQAVVRRGDKYMFFGGVQRNIDRKSQVKTRLQTQAFKNLMEQCSDVFIMGHDVADLDSFGSSLGILPLARYLKKDAFIVLDNKNSNITAIIQAMKSYKEYSGVLIGSNEAVLMIKPTSMLIIADTQILSHTEAPKLFSHTKNVVILDHHLRGTSYIENPQIIFHEPYASSTCEIVTEIIRYFDENVSLLPMEAEALLAGITIDTKGFSFKTGVRTFEAASYLRRCGADTMSIRALFQDDLQTFSNRSEVVRRAHIIKGGVAISIVPDDMEQRMLIAAQAADSLLTIRGIVASFVLSRFEDTVVISGRSLGTINVQLILEKLGGGGHSTIAGAKIKNADLDKIHEQLVLTIDEYIKEEKK